MPSPSPETSALEVLDGLEADRAAVAARNRARIPAPLLAWLDAMRATFGEVRLVSLSAQWTPPPPRPGYSYPPARYRPPSGQRRRKR